MSQSRLALVCLCVPVAALAQPSEKRFEPFSIFNPVPRADRRAMSADRPDFTESPYTLDAGAVQIEMSFFDYARSGDTDTWAIAPSNIKVGLLDDADIQFVLAPYIRERGGADDNEGFGDTQIRLKINLWGNDGGQTALAIMPFIQIPTASDGLGHNHVEGGLILPFAIELTDGIGLGLMFEADFVYDDERGNYETELIATAAVGFDITADLGAYAELIASTGADGDSDDIAILGLGATYAITSNLQFDAGVNIGLTDDADDMNVFSGMTVRF